MKELSKMRVRFCFQSEKSAQVDEAVESDSE